MDIQTGETQRMEPARATPGVARAGTVRSAAGHSAALLGEDAQRMNAGPHATALAGLRSLVAQRKSAECQHARQAMGGTVRVTTRPAAGERSMAAGTGSGPVARHPVQAMLVKVTTRKAALGERVIDSVEFEGRVPTVVSGSQGDHVVAETLAQEALIQTCVGRTHAEAAMALRPELRHLQEEAVALVGARREKLGFEQVEELLERYRELAVDPSAEGEDRNTALEAFLKAFLRVWNKYQGSAYRRAAGVTLGGGREREAIGKVREVARTTAAEGADEEHVSVLAENARELIDFVPTRRLQEAVTHVSRMVELVLSSTPEMELFNQDVTIATAREYATRHGLNDQETSDLVEAVLNRVSERPEYEEEEREEEEEEEMEEGREEEEMEEEAERDAGGAAAVSSRDPTPFASAAASSSGGTAASTSAPASGAPARVRSGFPRLEALGIPIRLTDAEIASDLAEMRRAGGT